LAIEGGGVRGIIPARVLTSLETLTERPISELFDVIVGTSTGGMLALGLASPNDAGEPAYSAAHVTDIYRQYGEEIFPRSSYALPRSIQDARDFWTSAGTRAAMFGFNPDLGNARYSPTGIEEAFHRYFEDRKLSEALVDVVITAYDFQTKTPVLFRSRDARRDETRNPLMRDVARATSAAPTYFPPLELAYGDVEERVLVDGGIFANNPTLIAYAEGVSRAKAQGLTESDVTLVFLGTGKPERKEPLTLKEFTSRSWIKLAEDIFRAAEDGQSALLDSMLHQVVGDNYWSFQTPIREGVSYLMDDVSKKNVAALTQLGDEMVGKRLSDLKRLAADLVR
jgi:predicted acylesterase/phospholipase RssA